MEGEGKETGGSSVETQRHEDALYKAAFEGDLQAVMGMLGKEKGLPKNGGFEWDTNPLCALIEGRGRPRVAVLLLRHYGPEVLLLQARCCPESGNTLLHHAALRKKEKLAILLIKSLPPSNNVSLKRQRFLEAMNHSGQTLLHIAADNLLSTLIAELLKEKYLKVNIKDNNGETVLDLIRKKCYKCSIMNDWKTPWRISISLRGASAKLSRNLGKFEDEEDIIRKHSAVEMLFMNDEAWNITTNIIVVVATLAFALVFAAIFTIPQTVTLEGDNSKSSRSSTQMANSNNERGSISTKEIDPTAKHLRDSLFHNVPFNVFVCSSTVACIFMIYVLVPLLATITSKYSSRALVFLFAWLSFGFMGISLIVAYNAAIYMFMGSAFTYILIGCATGILLLAITLAMYFDILKSFLRTCQSILRMTLLHGLVVTLMLTFFPTSFVVLVEKILFSI